MPSRLNRFRCWESIDTVPRSGTAEKPLYPVYFASPGSAVNNTVYNFSAEARNALRGIAYIWRSKKQKSWQQKKEQAEKKP